MSAMPTRSPSVSALHRQTALDYLSGTQFLTTAMDMFLVNCRSKRLSQNTIDFYTNYLRKFAKYADARAVHEIHQLDAALLRGYLLDLAADHKPGGVHAAFRTLRAFLNWAAREELVPTNWRNPISRIDPPRVPEHVMEGIPLQDAECLLSTCRGSGFYDRRDKAVLLLLLDTGLRASEVCKLDLGDIELATGHVIVREGKGGKDRIVFAGPTTLRAVRGYLRTRADTRSPALLINKSGQRLTYDGLRQILERRCAKAGVQRRYSPHDFRRAFAVTMLRNGADIFSLARILGHSDIQVLRRYLGLNTQDLCDAHTRSSPVEQHQWR